MIWFRIIRSFAPIFQPLEEVKVPDARIARLEGGVGGELEGESAEGEGEDALVVVVDAGVRGAERLVDLLDGRRHLGAVEEHVAAEGRERPLAAKCQPTQLGSVSC